MIRSRAERLKEGPGDWEKGRKIWRRAGWMKKNRKIERGARRLEEGLKGWENSCKICRSAEMLGVGRMSGRAEVRKKGRRAGRLGGRQKRLEGG